MNLEHEVAEEKRRILAYLPTILMAGSPTVPFIRIVGSPTVEAFAEGLANHLVRNRVQVEQAKIAVLVEALEATLGILDDAWERGMRITADESQDISNAKAALALARGKA